LIPFVASAFLVYFGGMRNIVVLGAGRSSGVLIEYLLEHSTTHDWSVTVADRLMQATVAAVKDHPRGTAVLLDPGNQEETASLIRNADVVISMLPPSWHVAIATLCLRERRHLLTASYVTADMKALDAQAQSAGLLFLNECGLDPGLDHMSAMETIDRIHEAGGSILSFESFTGGLIAPDTDPGNPWRYKFTWNPRNVVVAGQQGNAEYLRDGKIITVPYTKLFTSITQFDVPGIGVLEGYPNRDSLRYIDLYGIQETKTILRGTLRYKGFCPAWNVLVQLGCCDDNREMNKVADMTHADFIRSFIPASNGSVEASLAKYAGVAVDGHEMECLRWSGLFNEELIGLTSGTPAQILEHILMKRWALNENDRDLVVMLHRFVYKSGDGERSMQVHMTRVGTKEHTAMATTVGLPLGVATKLLLEDRITLRGVAIPVKKELYVPILHELADKGINFILQSQ
jgi:saccharopine dehydrogenase-like NADP-dependent oxidoreductase